MSDKKLEYFSSGSTLVDCMLGGGWASGILITLEGESQAGKTLLAQEAAANYLSKWSGSYVNWYDAEHAFNEDYANVLGIPIDQIDFPEDINTVEDLFNSLTGILEAADEDSRGLCIVDSLDALSDFAEMNRDIKEGTFGATKPRKLSEIFRRINALLNNKNITLMIIQQLRDVLNSPVPNMKKASGGRGPEFYASQRVRVQETSKNGKIKRTAGGVERIIGTNILAKCIKNRVGKPFRTCEFKIIFDYGIDDIASNLEFLELIKATEALERITGDAKPNLTTYCKKMMELTQEEHNKKRSEIAIITSQAWEEVEARFTIGVKKY